jgi:hypothetical protein
LPRPVSTCFNWGMNRRNFFRLSADGASTVIQQQEKKA